ncbi:MAG: hypothetical protein CSA51_04425 [Gammaproteobacteria bacterium]|nr:MAG: hypothetical protein CSA51_04425 [Gammaproteobacteria bacterium]
MATQRYSRLSTLVIVWCLVAYVASGFIIFGPRKDYLKTAGSYAMMQLADRPVYANDSFFLFYAGKNPERQTSWASVQMLAPKQAFYYAYDKNRNRELPKTLQDKTPIQRFANRRGDTLLIYAFEHQ